MFVSSVVLLLGHLAPIGILDVLESGACTYAKVCVSTPDVGGNGARTSGMGVMEWGHCPTASSPMHI